MESFFHLEYRGIRYKLISELFEDEFIQLSLSNSYKVLDSKYFKSYREIVREYPWINILYESPPQFMSLVEHCLEKGKVWMKDHNIICLRVEIGHQEKQMELRFTHKEPSTTEI